MSRRALYMICVKPIVTLTQIIKELAPEIPYTLLKKYYRYYRRRDIVRVYCMIHSIAVYLKNTRPNTSIELLRICITVFANLGKIDCSANSFFELFQIYYQHG